jgi:hypothetical protein
MLLSFGKGVVIEKLDCIDIIMKEALKSIGEDKKLVTLMQGRRQFSDNFQSQGVNEHLCSKGPGGYRHTTVPWLKRG